MNKSFPMLVFALLIVPDSMFAQEQNMAKNRFGLTFPEIGIIWHISDNIAFMPTIDFGHDWSKTTIGIEDSIIERSGNRLGVDASLRLYVSDWKDMHFYISPKYGFSWANTNINNTDYPYDEYLYDGSSHSHKASAAWGIQYAINSRISLFGDIGAAYSRTSSSSSSNYSNTIFTEGTWGLILYLK